MHLPRACGPMTPPRQDVLGRPGLSPETRADHACKGLNLALRHGIAPGQVMSGEQEHVLDSRLFLRLRESLRAAFGRAEEAEGIGNAVRLILGYRCGIERLPEFEASIPKPPEVRGARVGKEGLAGGDPAPHPPRRQRRIGAEAEGDYEDDGKALQVRPARRAPASRRRRAAPIAAGWSPTIRKAPSATSQRAPSCGAQPPAGTPTGAWR